ncbi:16856_t:CDS:2, partial [Funneliformis geosporum]
TEIDVDDSKVKLIKEKRKKPSLIGIHKIPKLASLALSPLTSDINTQEKIQPTLPEKKDE